MVKLQLDYIDLKYTPKKTDVVTELYIEPNNISLEAASQHAAAESSIGTWTDVSTMKRYAAKLRPRVFSINKRTKTVKIAYPGELFEPGNMPSFLSGICGNLFGMKAVKNLRVQDIHFPKFIVQSFPGPRFGVKGIRRVLGIKKRPFVGTIIKPKLGLKTKDFAKAAFEAWMGGLDIVKDDENLTNQSFNPFKERVYQVLKMRDKVQDETGERKVYFANVTAESYTMLERADFVRSMGGEYIMVDVITVGWAAVQTLRHHCRQIIHGHRAMHAAMTRNPKHGISMVVLGKIGRLVGVDQIHTGTALVGKMQDPDTRYVEDVIEHHGTLPDPQHHLLRQEWYGLNTVLPVASGGLHPGLVPDLLQEMGTDIAAMFGGGCHGHPWGSRAGARAIRQAVEAAMTDIPLHVYAEHHRELKAALKKWGTS